MALEFLGEGMLTHVCANSPMCSSSQQEQRWTIRKAGYQALFALLL